MLKQLTAKVDNRIAQLIGKNIFTNYLGLARSVLASSTLLTLLFNNVDTLFKPDGIGNTRMYNLFWDKLNYFYLLPYEQVNILKWIAIAILLLVISGWMPKITAVLHYWVCVSFINSVMMIEGGDQVVSNLSLFLIPVCLCDPRKNHWHPHISPDAGAPEQRLIANFFHFLIRLQVAFIYFHAAAGKMPISDWANGTAVYYWFNNPTFGMCDWMKPILNPLLSNPYIIVLLTWGVIFFEFLLFLALFIDKKYYKYLLFAGLVFHLAIIVIHGLFSFFLAMAGALLLFLAPMDTNFRWPFSRIFSITGR